MEQFSVLSSQFSVGGACAFVAQLKSFRACDIGRASFAPKLSRRILALAPNLWLRGGSSRLRPSRRFRCLAREPRDPGAARKPPHLGRPRDGRECPKPPGESWWPSPRVAEGRILPRERGSREPARFGRATEAPGRRRS